MRAAAVLLLAVFALHSSCNGMVITLQNKSNFTVVLTPTGATIQKLLVPECKKGKGFQSTKLVDVALGYDDLAGYAEDPHPSFGATVGRVGNRISNAQFILDGQTYKLLANDGTACIHGGLVRWSKMVWAAEVSPDKLTATFTRTSKDGESGFPGTVKATVVYSIPAEGTHLNITMTATTDKATPLNIINHNYFNLKGAGNGDVLDHVVQIFSRFYTPAPPGELLPTGQVFKVAQTPYDFTTATPIRKNYLKANGGPYKGYDTNYVMPQKLDNQEPVWWLPGQNPQVAKDAPTKPLTLGAAVTEPSSGLKLKVWTNAPGIHFYSGNFLNGKPGMAAPGKGGVYYPQYGGLAFETQAFPNAINTPTFPNAVVRPGEVFSNRVSYDFSCT